ncbi:uncharacterized protein N7484_006840 [Penicillium longicatenatum]|uniref:uncharacterized protein n=1 Tax=Penicillium longicatenatum TaxID=1561947 RepID=UPI00254753A5|nr:uncharacterized protein N7484_006840 [Penicillium longicatenatum]KAJ5638978.1 hypothetical protein N7484_006840 [Penicillium longicatenatum]
MVESSSLQKDSNVNRTNPDRTVPLDPYHEQHLTQSFPIHVLSPPQSSLTSVNLHCYSDSYCIQSGERRLPLDGSPMSTCGKDVVDSFGTVQESCLMRYFIEELSPWFDHCDDRRHFQLEVPRRAYCPTLKNAIFAVAARHLGRLPKYKTSRGIVYCGQSLPDLKKSSALEYMLKCIPDLIQFPEIQDPLDQENIMAATVILRQYEEMEEEMDEVNQVDGRVNFLAITKAIIDSMIASPLDQSLANAAYWVTVRQEIYYALTRKTVPHLRFDWQPNHPRPVANNFILFTGEVAQWRWGKQIPEEWARLKLKEQQLVQAVQHLRLAQLILVAENPNLENATRAMHRKAEAQVRSTVLEICGLAIDHPRIKPALVNAVIAITLYGEYFTDPVE